MLNNLAFRNAKRSIGDYIVYIMTMIFIVSLIYAFNSMIFSDELWEIMSEPTMIAAMIGLATFFIVIIFIWLINYMINFILEKRSKEFSIYSLIGFRKKVINRVFFRENIIIGIISFIFGVILGLFIQQILFVILYNFIGIDYKFNLNIKIETILLTFAIFFGAYLISLFKNRRKIKKMNILDMMNVEKENENRKNTNKTWKSIFFYIAIIFFIIFYYCLFTNKINQINVWLFVIGTIFSIYFQYIGLSEFLIRYIKKERKGIWKESNIFLLRQFSSKIKTMQFTLGTLTVIFSIALIGASCAFMLNVFQKNTIKEKWPFDIAVYNENPEYDFKDKLEEINSTIKTNDEYIYKIYENETDDFNKFATSTFPGSYRDNFFKYDTYMKLSDYNNLREILGYSKVDLKDDEYIYHVKKQFEGYTKPIKNMKIDLGENELHCSKIFTEPFQQAGYNGADYILIVQDNLVEQLSPYYSLLMVTTDEKNVDKLSELSPEDLSSDYGEEFDRGRGTEQILSMGLKETTVKYVETRDMRLFSSLLIFPLFYIGIVFLVVALAILSTQQLSDFSKYKYRYDILSKMGMSKKNLEKLIFKQILYYYLIPFVCSILISGGLILFLTDKFIYFSGSNASLISFFLTSVLLYGSIYILYIAITYVNSKRNLLLK